MKPQAASARTAGRARFQHTKSHLFMRITAVTAASAILTACAMAPRSSSAEDSSARDAMDKTPSVAAKSGCVFALKDVVARDFLSYRDGAATTADQVKDPVFGTFISDVLDRLRTEIGVTGDCVAVSKVTFVRLPLVTVGNAAGSYLAGRGPAGRVAGVWSPWVDADVGQTGLEITFYYNERQFVVDRATEALGARIGTGFAMPVESADFTRYGRLWQPLVIYGMDDKARDRLKVSLRAALPQDIFWLFENSAQSERGGPFANNAYYKAKAISKEDYGSYLDRTARVLLILINHKEQKMIISSVLDIRNFR